MIIYIVRHGETMANVDGRMSGWTDDALNDYGLMLAHETGKALKGVHFDAAFSSPLSRAMETCRIILDESGNDCGIQSDRRIMEINMGEFEGRKSRDKESQKYIAVPALDKPFPGGESVRDVMDRTWDFLTELSVKNYETVLVSSHGCAVRAMLNRLYENRDDFWQGGVPLNCCINIVEAKDGKMNLKEKDVILYDRSLCIDRYKDVLKR